MDRNRLTVSDEAAEQAAFFRLSPGEVLAMARMSAPVTHQLGNHRFDLWVMEIHHDQVLAFAPLGQEATPEEKARLREGR
jgi:hypothetical protein